MCKAILAGQFSEKHQMNPKHKTHGSSFASVDSLVHEGHKVYKCESCGKSFSVSSNKAFLMETCSANSSQKIGCNCTGISFSIWRYFLLQVRHIPAGKLLLLSMKSGNSLQIIGILPSLIRLRFDLPKHPRHTWKYIIWTFFASNAHVLILSY